jgi:hypothetical protein
MRNKKAAEILGSCITVIIAGAALASLQFVLLDWPQGIGWSGWPGYMPGTL